MAASNPWIRISPWLLSLMRIILALMFMQHGANKLFGVPGDHFALISMASLLSLHGLAGILETFGGFLLLIGLFARPIAFILSGEMAFAYFLAHFPANHVFPFLNGGDLAVVFCFAFLYLSAAGPGPFSVDRARGRARAVHHSGLCSIIIDCRTDDLDAAARFWSAALGRPLRVPAGGAAGGNYRPLATLDDEPVVEVQRVEHDSRVHLDIESDDIEAEVRRLEALGAKRVAAIKTWVVMQAPTGQRFCVVRPQRHGNVGPRANEWP